MLPELVMCDAMLLRSHAAVVPPMYIGCGLGPKARYSADKWIRTTDVVLSVRVVSVEFPDLTSEAARASSAGDWPH